MTTPYLPLEFTENLVRERHPDPRIITSQGSSPVIRITHRQRFGGWLVRLGRRLEGHPAERHLRPGIPTT